MLTFKLRLSTIPIMPPFTIQCQPFLSTFPARSSPTLRLRIIVKQMIRTPPDKTPSFKRWPALQMSIWQMAQANAWISKTLITSITAPTTCHSLTMATRSSNVIKCLIQLVTTLHQCFLLSHGRNLTLESRVRLDGIYFRIIIGSKIVSVEIILPRTLNIIQTSFSQMVIRTLGSQLASRSTYILNCLSLT